MPEGLLRARARVLEYVKGAAGPHAALRVRLPAAPAACLLPARLARCTSPSCLLWPCSADNGLWGATPFVTFVRWSWQAQVRVEGWGRRRAGCVWVWHDAIL